jgi:hypothetical protein
MNTKSFESSISLCKTLKNEYTNVIIHSNSTRVFSIQLVNENGQEMFSKSTSVNSETKAIAIPMQHYASGNYRIQVCNQNECASMSFTK